MNLRPIHPFPARMAPDIAVAYLKELQPDSLVLDPMVGSGTVLRHASELGHRAIGFDMDPLSVLMAKVWTTPIDEEFVEEMLTSLLSKAEASEPNSITLPWVDGDRETSDFIDFWFASPQKDDLKCLSFALNELHQISKGKRAQAVANLLRVAFSRLIITKNNGASLARDVSHSRPHRVAEKTDFDVFTSFDKAVRLILGQLRMSPPTSGVKIYRGDARSLGRIDNSQIDAVLTSPPYLNAIDYMRGHRMSLVWLGYKIGQLRLVRSNSVGAERGPDKKSLSEVLEPIQSAMAPMKSLERRQAAMIVRYSHDIFRMLSEIARVLKPAGKAILVVGNSCLKGVFIHNSGGILTAAQMVGLKLRKKTERDLPPNKRYLPIPERNKNPLGKRMRTETILTFSRS